MLLLGGVAAALLLVFEAKSINRSGGWGWLLVIGVYVVAIIVVCSACAICAAVSLYRHESHRRLSIAILVISCLVVAPCGRNLIRAAGRLRHQHDEATHTSEVTLRPPAGSIPPATIPPAADKSSSTPVVRDVENPQMSELKSSMGSNPHQKCRHLLTVHVNHVSIPPIREENRMVEILLRSETIDVEIRKSSETGRDHEDQRPNPRTWFVIVWLKMMLRSGSLNGRVGELIGEQNGKWYIITLPGIRLSTTIPGRLETCNCGATGSSRKKNQNQLVK
jgi:hypothetical protein